MRTTDLEEVFRRQNQGQNIYFSFQGSSSSSNAKRCPDRNRINCSCKLVEGVREVMVRECVTDTTCAAGGSVLPEDFPFL